MVKCHDIVSRGVVCQTLPVLPAWECGGAPEPDADVQAPSVQSNSSSHIMSSQHSCMSAPHTAQHAQLVPEHQLG